jgi:hypothetical protein
VRRQVGEEHETGTVAVGKPTGDRSEHGKARGMTSEHEPGRGVRVGRAVHCEEQREAQYGCADATDQRRDDDVENAPMGEQLPVGVHRINTVADAEHARK